MWHLAVCVKLILYIVLCIYISKTRQSIYAIDSAGIMKNFNMCKYFIYALLAYSYLMFLAKFFIHQREHKIMHHHYCGINYVNMALISMLFVLTRQANSVISMSQNMPISVEMIDTRFKPVETLGYLLSGFNIVSAGVAFGSQYLHSKGLMM